ncbi:Dabb family protein [Belliella kenyensis]|uniref:Dabb family protein n=1 Tax=Belliella kenyensis TaxID=1472724 RepID=A0ABV8EK60_9BACT|nr:Dabb family protein [Belliella kenyensis]MCH7400307.1 Dabb family protein [Belliella kenyensis]MDN3604675.1 Dabb family protein [Belliella kenyensis]
MKSRRNFIKKVALAGATASLSGSLYADNHPKQRLYHQVFFWLTSEDEIPNFLEGVKMLGKCKTVADAVIGTPAPTKRRDVVDHSFHVSCLVIFDSVEDHDVYQEDPLHLQFIEEYGHLFAEVKVYDYLV